MSFVDGSSLILSDAQIYNYARLAGFSAADRIMATAVALAESGGNAHIVNDKNNDGSYDFGLMQINSVHASNPAVLAINPGFFTLKQWKIPLTNMRAAKAI